MIEFMIFVAVAFSLPALILGVLQIVAPAVSSPRQACCAGSPASSSGS